jgi:hypothetical protein
MTTATEIRTVKCWMWPDGVIGVGEDYPPDALPLARGPEEKLRVIIAGIGRLGHKGEHLVPGVPEARDIDAACDAALAFSRQITVRLNDPEED